VGSAFAAKRDLFAFLRHGDDAAQNPLRGSIRTTLLHGCRKAGGMPRLLALGFNQDEDGRIVFDGMNPNIASGFALNIRLRNPAGDSVSSTSEHTIGTEHGHMSATPDPIIGEMHGLLDRCEATSPAQDIQTVTDTGLLAARHLLVTATQRQSATSRSLPTRSIHDAVNIPERAGRGAGEGHLPFLSNPNSYHYTLRALMVALQIGWSRTGRRRAAAIRPIARRTRSLPTCKLRFPKIPGHVHGQHNPPHVYIVGHSSNPPPTRAHRHRAARSQSGDLVVLMPRSTSTATASTASLSDAEAPARHVSRMELPGCAIGEGDLCRQNRGFIFAATKRTAEARRPRGFRLEERYGRHDGYVAAVRKAADAWSASA